MTNFQKILIIDFGSQYTQLIARRVRENHIYSEIFPHTISAAKITEMMPAGIILSGGPMSVYEEDSPKIPEGIFKLGIPILGICYGLQLIATNLGGKVEHAEKREYGKAHLEILNDDLIFKNVANGSIIWMSHGDLLTAMPEGFHITAGSDNSPLCAIANPARKIYGVQFHPEVAHTECGNTILRNFLFDICGCSADWTAANFINSTIEKIKVMVGNKKVICALSGGVDSSVAAVLLHKAVGDQLICIHVDHGLMRKNESTAVLQMFNDCYEMRVDNVDVSDLFLTRLAGVIDPEKKRKIIGNSFIEIFEHEASKIPDAQFLVQGTLYPDVIESVSVKGASVTIKTHHNVGGLPERMNLKLIEPFRELFKDEVRAIGRELKLPEKFIGRHPFPGPGLAVRILSDITREKLDTLREADDIFISELHSSNLYNKIWQAFAVLLPIQTVGVMGDARTYEHVLALRAVTSTDGMTADWFRFEPDFLENVSNKIIRSVRGINRVVYDISSKPPATIEWE